MGGHLTPGKGSIIMHHAPEEINTEGGKIFSVVRKKADYVVTNGP